MERIVNFFNRTVDIGSWLISCIAIYVVMLPAVLMPLIMGQQLLFFNKKSFKVPKSDAFLLDLVAKMPRSAKLKGLNLRYPIAWRDFLLRNTMSTGKLRNMMFKISHFWDEKRPTKKSEDRIPTMLLPASPQPAIPRPALKYFWNNRRQESVPFVLKVHPSSPSRLSVHGLLWRTSETIGMGSYAIRFKSPSQRPVTDVRPRPTPTARSDGLLKQSAWEALPFVSKVHPSGPSRTSVHGPPPRPALNGFWNNRREELVPFVSKVHPSGPSRTSVHGPLWQTSETIGVRNSCRLFQKSIPAARHGRPSTARPHGPLWLTFETIGARKPCHLFQKSIPAARHGRPSTARPPTARSDRLLKQSAWGTRAVCFKSPSQRPVTDVRPRPAPTVRSDWLLKQSAWGTRAVCFKSPSQRPVTDVRPRPAPTVRSDGLLKQSAWGTRAVCFKSPSQRPVTDVRPRPAPTVRSDWLLQQSAPGIRAICFKSPSQQPVTASRPRSALTASYGRLLKHLASEIHLINFFSKAHRSGPSRPSVHDPLSQPALTHIVKAIFIENCCFSKSIKPKIICNPDLIFGLAEHLVTMTLYTTTHFECATLTLHSNSGLSFYLALESTEVEWNIIEWSAIHTAPRKTWSNIIFLRLESF